MQAGVGRQAMEKSAANTNTLSRFETEVKNGVKSALDLFDE